MEQAGEFRDHQDGGVEDVQEEGGGPADVAGALAQQPVRAGVAGRGRVDEQADGGLGDDAEADGLRAERGVGGGGLQAAGAAARAGRAGAGDGQVRDVSGGGAGALVDGALDAEGGVDDVADEEMDEAAAGVGVPEQDFGGGDGAGVVVEADGEPEGVGQLGGQGRSRQPSASCRTTVPSSGRTQPPRAAPRPRRGRPVSYSSRNARSWRAIACGSVAGSRPWCGRARRARTWPRRSTRPKVEAGTPMCRAAVTGPERAPVLRSSGTRGRPRPPPGAGQLAQQPGAEQAGGLARHGGGAEPAHRGIPLRATGPCSRTARSTAAALAEARLSPAMRGWGVVGGTL
ncbi:hypothetical protein GCM10020254_24460 [Streptomyces goshikiensis]